MIALAIDPGQRGAVAAVRLTQLGRLEAVAIAHAGGRGGYQAGERHLAPLQAWAAVEDVLGQVGQPMAPGAALWALEALGLRAGEGVASTATTARGWAVWWSVLHLSLGPGCGREVTAQGVDARMGLPRGLGRTLRKTMVLERVGEEMVGAGLSLDLLTPPGGRVASDGAGDAVWMALALGRGL